MIPKTQILSEKLHKNQKNPPRTIKKGLYCILRFHLFSYIGKKSGGDKFMSNRGNRSKRNTQYTPILHESYMERLTQVNF